MLKEIRKDIKKRMDGYTDSRQPTGDEVRIAWLIGEIDKLYTMINGDEGEIENDV